MVVRPGHRTTWVMLYRLLRFLLVASALPIPAVVASAPPDPLPQSRTADGLAQQTDTMRRPSGITTSVAIAPTPRTPPSVKITGVPAVVPLPRDDLWRPALNTTWQWQLTTPVDQSLAVQMYDIDLFDNDVSVVTSLHAKGHKVVCYLDAGTAEPNRPDRSQFPASVIGSGVQGWPGEQWLDIRNLTVLAPIMAARFDLCKQKGFDAVEADNVDGFQNRSGFPLTAQDQLTYNRWLSAQAHLRGLSIGLKNDGDQVLDLVTSFDWSLVEQCYSQNACPKYLPFVAIGKPVFVVEYSANQILYCASMNLLNFNGLIKNLALDAPRTACR